MAFGANTSVLPRQNANHVQQRKLGALRSRSKKKLHVELSSPKNSGSVFEAAASNSKQT